jgi:ribokinase
VPLCLINPVAAARLGANVSMIGCVGDDSYGKSILENLIQNNVNIQHVNKVKNVESGTAHIVLAEGDNSIILVKGANDVLDEKYILSAMEQIKNSDIVLIQQEIPEQTVKFVSEICRTSRVPLMLNPAPARKISSDVIEAATYLTPNENEFRLLFPDRSREKALQQYPNKLLIMEGKNGVRFYDGTEEMVVPSYEVEAVDTTGAGDTFNGAFAVAITEGRTIHDSLQFANFAASISVTKFGAQGGMPRREELEAK